MTNTLNIQYHPITGEAVAFQLTNGSWLNEGIPFHDATIGDLVDGASTISYGDDLTYPFLLNAHADDPENEVGLVNFTRIKNLVKHTIRAHHADAPIPLWQQGLNALGKSIANIFGRLESVEKALATLGMMDKRIFVKWIVRGTEFQCEMPNVDDGLASFDLKSGFDGFSEDLNPDDPNDSRQMMYLKTREFGTFRIITARQELGRIRDAVNANAAEAVHSEALPETEPAE